MMPTMTAIVAACMQAVELSNELCRLSGYTSTSKANERHQKLGQLREWVDLLSEKADPTALRRIFGTLVRWRPRPTDTEIRCVSIGRCKKKVARASVSEKKRCASIGRRKKKGAPRRSPLGRTHSRRPSLC